MMFLRKGMTLMEIMIVLIMIAIAAVFFFPNFTTSTEHARAINVQNNLLAIYTAQQTYYTNNANYCLNIGSNQYCGDTLAHLDTNLSLNIQDDGTYLYYCTNDPTGFRCMATRNLAPSPLEFILLDKPIQLSAGMAGNPECASPSGNSNWCP